MKTKPKFQYHIAVDTVLHKDDKKFVLGPGQAFLLRERSWNPFSATSKITLEIADGIIYAGTHRNGFKEYFALSDRDGDDAYISLNSSNAANGILGYGCGIREYRVTEAGLELLRVRRNDSTRFYDTLATSRRVLGMEVKESPVTDYGDTHSLLPTIMVEVEDPDEIPGGWSNTVEVMVPGEGEKSLVKVPIPLLVGEYLPYVEKYGYSREDATFQQKELRRIVESFYRKVRARAVYIGLPDEGQAVYEDPEDIEKLWEEEEYLYYSRSTPLRLCGSSYWSPKGKFRAVDGVALHRMFSILETGKVDLLSV